MPQLDTTWFASQLFWLFITFAMLYVVLAKYVLPALQDVVARRQQTVSGDIAEAERLKGLAEQARQEYERMMAQARSHAQNLMQDALSQQKAKAEQAARDMDRQIEQKLVVATQQITTRKIELLEALAPTVIDLTAMIVEKLTQRAPTRDKVQQVVGALSKK